MWKDHARQGQAGSLHSAVFQEEIRKVVDWQADELRSALIERRRKWESAGRPHRKGRTPLQIILEERESRAGLSDPSL